MSRSVRRGPRHRPRSPGAARRCAFAALAATAILAGCGSGDDEESAEAPLTVPVGSERSEELTAGEAAVLVRTERSVNAYCRRVAAVIARGSAPSAEDFARVNAALEELYALAAERPDAVTAAGRSPMDALGAIAEDLEGTNCDPRLVARIDARLAVLP
jgi:hypothetical protein